MYSIGVLIAATVVLGALQPAYPDWGRDPNQNYTFGFYLSPFGQAAIITFLLVLLTTALAGLAALHHSRAHGRTRWARAFAPLLAISLLAPVLFALMLYGRLPQLVNGVQEAVITVVSALGFLLLAILTLVYSHRRGPDTSDAR